MQGEGERFVVPPSTSPHCQQKQKKAEGQKEFAHTWFWKLSTPFPFRFYPSGQPLLAKHNKVSCDTQGVIPI